MLLFIYNIDVRNALIFLILSQNDKFETLPNWKSLQMTILNVIKVAESSFKGYETLREKEKLLILSKFSFSHSVFKRLVRQTHKNKGLFGKGLGSLMLQKSACYRWTLSLMQFCHLLHDIFNLIHSCISNSVIFLDVEIFIAKCSHLLRKPTKMHCTIIFDF